jgi:hypothetical protein
MPSLSKSVKFAAMAAVMVLSAAVIQWVWLGIETPWLGWIDAGTVLQVGSWIVQLAMSAAVFTLLTLEPRQQGRTPGIVLAAGLVGATLVWMPGLLFNTGLAICAEGIAPCLALGLLVVLVRTGHRDLLWPGMAALLGALTQVGFMLWVARSF